MYPNLLKFHLEKRKDFNRLNLYNLAFLIKYFIKFPIKFF